MNELNELAAKVVETFKEKKLTLATAESITGGMVASAVTGIPGASSVLCFGYVTYTDKAKQLDLNVSRVTLENYTAVSSQTAEEMACGLHNRSGCSVCASVTGYAGPGDEETGLYYVGIWAGGKVVSTEFRSSLTGRNEIRNEAACNVLKLVLNAVDNKC